MEIACDFSLLIFWHIVSYWTYFWQKVIFVTMKIGKRIGHCWRVTASLQCALSSTVFSFERQRSLRWSVASFWKQELWTRSGKRWRNDDIIEHHTGFILSQKMFTVLKLLHIWRADLCLSRLYGFACNRKWTKKAISAINTKYKDINFPREHSGTSRHKKSI